MFVVGQQSCWEWDAALTSDTFEMMISIAVVVVDFASVGKKDRFRIIADRALPKIWVALIQTHATGATAQSSLFILLGVVL
eukprot:scaffold13670_cov92-Amphora_coffeaeformis.AAC.1